MSTQRSISVVIPCLNEADTIEQCVAKALEGLSLCTSITLQRNEKSESILKAISGEVIVADNGSTDGSIEKAIAAGAKVVHVREKGYGAALRGGIQSSNATWIVMGDADDSYDFREIPKFIAALQPDIDLVQGCRFPSGGGTIVDGAMPFLHRWFGNPALSWLVRRMFSIPIRDVYCGMRAFRKDHFDRLDLRSPGMEFATEMIIRSGLLKAEIREVPITLHRDGRKAHGPHLRTFRDGWRTLRLFLVFSPRWTFLAPGCILLLLGAIGYLVAIPQLKILNVVIDVHTLLVSSLALIIGWQCVLLAMLARIYAGREGLLPLNESLEKLSVENSIGVGIIASLIGFLMICLVVYQWVVSGFGPLDYPATMRWVVPGVTSVAIGYQTILSALFAGVLKMGRNRG